MAEKKSYAMPTDKYIDSESVHLYNQMMDLQEFADDVVVPQTRTINGMDLSENRVIYAQDVPSKNLLPNTASTTTNDITFTVNSDGTVTCNGTATSDEFLILHTFSASEASALNGMILNGCPSTGDENKYFIVFQQKASPYTTYGVDTGSGGVISGASAESNALIYVKSGQTLSNLVFRPMIRLASIEDDSYVPYAKTNVELSQGSAGSNYTKLPDGTLIQWGSATISAGSTSKAITFPINFYSTPTVIASAIYTNTRNDHVITAGESASGFTMYRNDPSTNQQFSAWLAIGRWK